MPFEYREVTLENIERVCIVHYRENLTACDILASEQGLFYSSLDQTPSFKVIYVRFIMPEPGKPILSETLELDPFQSRSQHTQKKNVEECYFTKCCISSQHSKKYSVFCGAKKSFSSRYVEICEDHL